MLTRVIEWSLRHRLVVVLVWAAVLVAGAIAFRSLPIDAFPDTTPVQVAVHAEARALSPVEIERRITAPLEQSLSASVPSNVVE